MPHNALNILFLVVLFFTICLSNSFAQNQTVAPTPPMGWNSFDAYDCAINEQQFRAVVDYMADHLLQYGWEYAVIDYIWWHPEPGNWNNPNRRFGHPDIRYEENGKPIDTLYMDPYGRLIPAPERFPSSQNGKGFGPLADYVHSKGMKFGIHIMRGIHRQAVYENTPILGTTRHARDIAEPHDTCDWCNHMYGVDPTNPGAQDYYNSLLTLYADWGVDFIKADDTMWPVYHAGEIEMIHKAIQYCGRPMVLSLSCGEAPLAQAEHLRSNANMWRISGDFWDNWKALKRNMDLLNAWSSEIRPNHWPDADMLPIGHLSMNGRPHGPDRMSHFTWDEHYTLMTLWCIARSPLMMGGDLLTSSEKSLSFLKNPEVLEVNQHSTDNRQVFKDQDKACWIAANSLTADRYVALFNLADKKQTVTFDFEGEQLSSEYQVRDLWLRKDIGIRNTLESTIAPHGAKLFRLNVVDPASGKEEK